VSSPIALTADGIRVEVVPEFGGKIAALCHLESGREWLLAPPTPVAAPPRYGSTFTEAPLWGWDEMLPTIDASGDLPDHGEVWALAWNAEALDDHRLRCWVDGRALPYRLVRDLELSSSSVTLDYELSAARPFPVLWAAHPQFVLDPDGTQLRLPAAAGELLDVDGGARVATAALVDPLEAVVAGRGRKLYVDPDARAGTATLADRRGPWLRLTWDPHELPYLGIWIDHGAYASRPVIAIEPSSGYYDSLERAVTLGRAAVVGPHHTLRWRLHVELGTGVAG
jgi:galactose mutarotase-like enzyme